MRKFPEEIWLCVKTFLGVKTGAMILVEAKNVFKYPSMNKVAPTTHKVAPTTKNYLVK